MLLHADSEDSDQTGRMPRLIWVVAGRTLTLFVCFVTFFVLSCRGSNIPYPSAWVFYPFNAYISIWNTDMYLFKIKRDSCMHNKELLRSRSTFFETELKNIEFFSGKLRYWTWNTETWSPKFYYNKTWSLPFYLLWKSIRYDNLFKSHFWRQEKRTHDHLNYCDKAWRSIRRFTTTRLVDKTYCAIQVYSGIRSDTV